MAYDKDFYRAYRAYLREQRVREAHDWVFGLLGTDRAFDNVLDLGCGQFNEFFHYAKPSRYTGIDLNGLRSRGRRRIISGDYRSLALLQQTAQRCEATAFVSVFSSEITADYKQNYPLYEAIFRTIPQVQSALVSGFFYTSRKHVNPIGETGGIVSYQTLEDIDTVSSDLFVERRIVLPVPSVMFGLDVFEVWKIFQRKKNELAASP